MKQHWYATALIAAALGCHKEEAPQAAEGSGVEDLTIVVEADKSRILQEEQSLQQKKESFEQERERLAKERSDVEQKLASLSKKDKRQRDELESQQQRLADEEKRIRDKARSFETDRDKLEDEKTKLLERISKMTATKGGLTIEQREQVIAGREKDVASREKAVAEREARLGEREKEVTKRIADVTAALGAISASGGVTKTVVVNAAAPMAGGASKASVDKLKKQVRGRMEQKGLLNDDLPPTAKELNEQASKATEERDYDSAMSALNEMLGVVDGIQVNGPFVIAKFSRISKLVPKPDEPSKKLMNEVSDAVTEGRFDKANKKINQLVALQQK